MPAPLVSDALWLIIKPLQSAEAAKPKGGPPRIESRKSLTGILFVLRTGIQWEMLPQEMGCGSGVVLAEVARLAAGGRVGWMTSCVACDRPTVSTGAGLAGIVAPSPPKKGCRDRSQSHRSRQARHQTPPDHRSARRPAGLPADRSPRPRQRAAGKPARHHPADPWQARPPTPSTGQAPCRQSLRSSTMPTRLRQTRHQAAHRTSRRRDKPEAGPTSLGH